MKDGEEIFEAEKVAKKLFFLPVFSAVKIFAGRTFSPAAEFFLSRKKITSTSRRRVNNS